jgi:DegV family protein with EDD domain
MDIKDGKHQHFVRKEGIFMANYKLVSDSTSNLFDMEGINYAYVPMKINCGGVEFVDTPALDLKNMEAQLKKSKERSGTSCPNAQEWLDAYEGGDHVFAVTITGTLSGSYSAARQAKADYEEAHPGARVHVINSLSAGPEMELILYKLKELIDAGKDFDTIKAEITEYQKHTRLGFALLCLDNLARNGRVNKAVAKVAGVLNIRVVGKASTEGTLEPMHKARGEAKMLSAILSVMEGEGYDGGRVILRHADNGAAAELLRIEIQQKFPTAKVDIDTCTGLCTYYAETGGLMIGFEVK